MKAKGLTAIEFMIFLAFAGIVASLGMNMFANNPGQTEARSVIAAENWAKKSGVTPQRSNCAPDADGDGYGSCTVVTQSGEKVYLQCAASWWNHFTGSKGCKEVETNIRIDGRLGSPRN